ncbi:MAG: GNAT family N-acetyltransferase, partial [Candidatus Eremiobacterota bacterium]
MSSLELGRAQLGTERDLLGAATAFVREIAATQGLEGQALDDLVQVVQEACLNVVQHAFQPGERGTYRVIVQRRPAQLAVLVEDQGLPMDLRKLEAGQGHRGLALMQRLSDELHFRNLGPGGKQVELVKDLPYRDLEAYLGGAPAPPAPDPNTPVELRLMVPEDTAGLARLIYRCYGYTYIRQTVYYPERAEELLRAGLMISAVAVTPDGEVVAHASLLRNSAREKIADSGEAVTDPRFRGRGLFTKLKKLLVEEARQRGFYGVYSEAVTVHPFTQKGGLALGAHEVGLQLAFSPQSVEFREIQEHSGTRTADMLTYLRVNLEPERTVYLPERHRAFLERLYAKLGLRRSFGAGSAPEGECRLDVELLTDINGAQLRLTPGSDVGSRPARQSVAPVPGR